MINQPAKDIGLVYTGTLTEAYFLKDQLEAQGIAAILRNDFSSSVMAGWVTPGAQNAVKLYVEKHEQGRSQRILDDYFADRNS